MTGQREDEMDLPCGCVMWNEGDAFVYLPHSPDCQYYLYVLEEAQRQGKDMMVRMA